MTPLDRDLFRHMESPAPPPGLKGRILRRARAQATVEEPSLVERLWYSRPLRLSWATLVVLLVVVQIQLLPSETSTHSPRETPTSWEIPELSPLLDRHRPRTTGRFAHLSTSPPEFDAEFETPTLPAPGETHHG